jgi:hypothetical protein
LTGLRRRRVRKHTPTYDATALKYAMNTIESIDSYIASQPEPKRHDLQALHERILGLIPGCRLWFLDGRDASGKVVSNPNIGYGEQALPLAGGKRRAFYQLGTSANTTGISVYIMGLEDRKALAAQFGKTIGKASVTGYCIKFRSLDDIDVDVLVEAMRYGLGQTGA